MAILTGARISGEKRPVGIAPKLVQPRAGIRRKRVYWMSEHLTAEPIDVNQSVNGQVAKARPFAEAP